MKLNLDGGGFIKNCFMHYDTFELSLVFCMKCYFYLCPLNIKLPRSR